MQTTSAEVLKSLPDFEDLMALATEISAKTLEKLSLELEIKRLEAIAVSRCSTEERFFVNGKPPSVAFLDATYKVTGIEGELLPVRSEHAKAIAFLEELKLKYDVYRNLFDIWRTLSANERSGAV